MEGIFVYPLFSLFGDVEGVVFDIGVDAFVLQVLVVFFGAITGIGGELIGQGLIGFFEALKVWDQRAGIGRVLMERVVKDELVMGGDLQVVAGFELAVFHVVFLHSHEGCICIGLGEGVALTQDLFLRIVLFDVSRPVFLRVAQLLPYFRWDFFFPMA